MSFIRSSALLLGILSIALVSPAVAAITEFGTAPIGSSVNSTIAIPLTAAQYAAQPSFTLHLGTDFTLGSCSATSNGCQLNVTFAPSLPGSRADAVIVKDQSGNVLAKAIVHGTGQGPLAAFSPGTLSLRLNQAGLDISSLAVDAKGSIYYFGFSQFQASLFKLDPGATSPTILLNGQLNSLSLDAAGDVVMYGVNGVTKIDGPTNAFSYVSTGPVQMPLGAVTDFAGNIFVMDQTSVHRIDAITGAITLVAGGNTGNSNGDGGLAVNAVLNNPQSIIIDSNGNLFIYEYPADIRRVDAVTQIITTVAGNGTLGYTGDGGPANLAKIGVCRTMSTDTLGNLYLADSTNGVLRKIDGTTQIITTVVGSPTGSSPQVGLLGNSVLLGYTAGLGFDSNGNLFISAGSEYGSIFEVAASAPTLPFMAPGSGPNPSLTESILNLGNAPLTIDSATVSGPFALQTTSSNPCTFPVALAADSSCQVTIAYDKTMGAANGALTLTDNSLNVTNATQQAVLALQFSQITLSASSMSFSAIVGLTTPKSLTITNSSSIPLSLQDLVVTGPNGAEFAVGGGCPATLQAQASCSLSISFAPVNAGQANATLVLNTNAQNSPATISLSGYGVIAGTLVPSSPSVNVSIPVSSTTSATQTLTLTNTGDTPINFISSPAIQGGGFELIANTCSLSVLPAASSCNISFVATSASVGTGFAIDATWYDQVTGATDSLNVPVQVTLAYANNSLLFVPMTPCRVVDTRNATGQFGGPEISGGTSRNFAIPASACNIPATAAAYSLNVTAVPEAELGYMSVWPAGQTMPLVSTLNSDGRVKANAAIVPSGANGAISVFASDNTHLVLDINGYFIPAAESGLAFYPLTPCRIADTRNATGSLGGPSLLSGISRSFPVLSSNCGIPATAQAYSLNITAIPSKPLGYLTAWPAGSPLPLASTLNAEIPTVTANASIVQAGVNGEVSVFASDTSDVVIDINGYFAPPGTGALAFYTLTPCRALDTRSGPAAHPFTGTLNVNIDASSCAVPTAAQAFALNATVVPEKDLDYLALWPAGESQPQVSTLNSAGAVVSNMAIVPTANGSISSYASQYTHLILDISGYFAPF